MAVEVSVEHATTRPSGLAPRGSLHPSYPFLVGDVEFHDEDAPEVDVVESNDKLTAQRGGPSGERVDAELRTLSVEITKVKERQASAQSFTEVVRLIFEQMNRQREEDNRRADAALERARQDLREERTTMRTEIERERGVLREERTETSRELLRLATEQQEHRNALTALVTKVNVYFSIAGAVSVAALGLTLSRLFH